MKSEDGIKGCTVQNGNENGDNGSEAGSSVTDAATDEVAASTITTGAGTVVAAASASTAAPASATNMTSPVAQATVPAESKRRPLTAKRLVGRQAGFALAFLIGANIAVLIIGLIVVLVTGKGLSSTEVMAWAQSLADPLPVLILFYVARSYRRGDNKLTGSTDELHLRWRSRRKMTVAALAVFVLIVLAVGVVAEAFDQAVQFGTDALGWSRTTTSDEIDAESSFVVGVVGTCLVAPVCEEILLRGIVMENLRQFGPVFAIITSSLLFGGLHGDLSQSVFAFLMGLLLGYIAWRYSLAWSIALHILNNSLSTLANGLPTDTFGNVLDVLGVIALVVLLVLAVLKKAEIKSALRRYRSPEHIYRAWRSPLFIFTLALCVVEMVTEFSF